MSDKESAQERSEVGDLPKPQLSEVSGDEHTSKTPSSEAGLTRAEALELIEKQWQSGKDRRWNELQHQYGELSEFRQALDAVKGGEDPDKVMTTVELRRLRQELEELRAPKPESAPQPSAGKQEVSEAAFQKAVSLVENAGLGNDPGTLALFKGKYSNSGDFLAAVAEHVLESKAQSGGVTDAIKAQNPGQGARQVSVDDLTDEYTNEMAANRGNKQAIRATQQKYRELGVPIDQIGFN